MIEKIKGMDVSNASLIMNPGHNDIMKISGIYDVECIMPNGKLRWKSLACNVVTDVGANLMLNQLFTTGGATANSLFFLGLISDQGYTGIPVVADTMASHASTGHVWVEAGNGTNYPYWSTPTSNARATLTWSAAGSRSKVVAAAASFTIATHAGTLKGCFIVTGSGAVATNNDTNGTLYSAGVFSGGDRAVLAADVVNVTYTTTLS